MALWCKTLGNTEVTPPALGFPRASQMDRADIVIYPENMHCRSAPAGDQALIQIVDSALADSTRRSGKWLVCRPGCSQCCVGVFAINQLDALRLRNGLAELELLAPERATRVRE